MKMLRASFAKNRLNKPVRVGVSNSCTASVVELDCSTKCSKMSESYKESALDLFFVQRFLVGNTYQGLCNFRRRG